jgi:hypothetical protein
MHVTCLVTIPAKPLVPFTVHIIASKPFLLRLRDYYDANACPSLSLLVY